MRKTFCPASRSRASRSISASRSTNAERGTTSPYTKGLLAAIGTSVIPIDVIVT
jgi:hypothetical protein